MTTIQRMAVEGKPVRAIARELGLSRNTVRKYLRRRPEPAGRRRRGSKLDPYKEQVRRWVREDHLLNCATMLLRLREQGYTGRISILKDFVQPLRPPTGGQRPVIRYETGPGEQMQVDWGEFLYEREGVRQKLYGFTAVLGYSRLRFVVFTKRMDTPTLIRSLMEACEYCGGLPKVVLTDRMKSVLLEGEGTDRRWNPLFLDFMTAVGMVPRVCKPATPQTKGKVERTVGVVEHSFWPGVQFVDLDDLNRQARTWCDERNQRVHRTTRQRPVDRWAEEGLHPLPEEFAWARFAAEERKVSWDGYLSYDGVLYGLPSEPCVAGTVVQVRERRGELTIYHRGETLVTLAKRPVSGEIVTHPQQFRTVTPAAAARQTMRPLGHQLPAPAISQRSGAEYDTLYGVEVPR